MRLFISADIVFCYHSIFISVDIISTVQFNHDGEFLATGDKGGRVVIFQKDLGAKGEYSVYSTFQSHEPQFDYLKSIEIEEKINEIQWLKRQNNNLFLLSTNDKVIKLWKVSERRYKLDGFNLHDEYGVQRDAQYKHPSNTTLSTS